MKDLPKMYQHRESKEFNNNRQVYYGMEKDNTNNILSSNDIRKKINDIINSPSFIYRTTVNIVIGNDTITRKIIGIHDNNLITIDNEYIPIDNIKDIYK
ncbi:MAG: hypothetical protein ACI4WU_02065 [Bacilli bacterium]